MPPAPAWGVSQALGRVELWWLMRTGMPSGKERGMQSERRALTLFLSSASSQWWAFSLLSSLSRVKQPRWWMGSHLFLLISWVFLYSPNGNVEENSSKENPSEGQRGWGNPSPHCAFSVYFCLQGSEDAPWAQWQPKQGGQTAKLGAKGSTRATNSESCSCY